MRTVMRAARSELSEAETRQHSEQIAQSIQSLIQWPSLKRLHAYRSNSMWREVDTSWLEAYVHRMWPHIDVVVGDISKTAQIPNSQFDVIIVPLLAFDERRSRLGLGGGWYDRFLSTQPHAVTIGLAHEVQKVSQVAVEPHDVALTHIVTEQSTY